MKRKQFLASMLPLLVSAKSLAKDAGAPDPLKVGKTPPFLKESDTVGITCPGGAIALDELQNAIRILKSWGFQVKIGAAIGKKDYSFGGTDAERAADMQQLLDDPGVKAILCARGGYGSVRIIDRLDFSHFQKRPKWIIGFSDITVLHSHIFQKYGISTLHSKMCNSFPENMDVADPEQRDSILAIRKALMGEKNDFSLAPHPRNKAGKGAGRLIGGNLKILETLSGTQSDIRTKGAILFLEDTGEYLYNIDRMFWNLKRTGKLDHLQGLVIGGFKIKPDDPGEEFGRSLQDIVLEQTASLPYPVCFDFPVGHQKNNFPLKCGCQYELDVNDTKVTLREI